ncbi:hypothetical protein DFR41_110121 [Pseudacidovorax intermedius]|uniref:HNH endonuclease n=1 Tax=Pseudacidovorax intermedius TaxID=433924 RepID=A0A370F9L1_9BURK|nr:hypothetical protein [Pseudacidovorax intermedius]RDI20713.1 hypothetical protein DFR41_110121 [Pseudacidovorax intermedius]
MRSLVRLGVEPLSYIDRYIAIRDSKHHATRARLVELHPLIVSRYDAYELALGLDALDGFESNEDAVADGNILRSCYAIATQALLALKEDIKAAQPERLLSLCPMCGITLPNTFDHYLPAIDFPELSVHPINLVPCCSTCNTKKDRYWITDEGERLFINFYSDLIPDTQFIFAQLITSPQIKSVGVNFYLNRPDGVEQEVWSLVERHFNRLHLLDRYLENGNTEISNLLEACSSHLAAGGVDAGLFLSHIGRSQERIFGKNHWTAVLAHALSVRQELNEWIERVS